jgi:hypothetical protein
MMIGMKMMMVLYAALRLSEKYVLTLPYVSEHIDPRKKINLVDLGQKFSVLMSLTLWVRLFVVGEDILPPCRAEKFCSRILCLYHKDICKCSQYLLSSEIPLVNNH